MRPHVLDMVVNVRPKTASNQRPQAKNEAAGLISASRLLFQSLLQRGTRGDKLGSDGPPTDLVVLMTFRTKKEVRTPAFALVFSCFMLLQSS